MLNEIESLPTIVGKDDWKKMIITFEPIGVQGLKEIGIVVGKSGWGCLLSVEGGEHAMVKMKKRAAELGAPIVLIIDGWHNTKNKPISGYGQGVRLVGKAYR
jgi:hypothetical protein